MIRIQGINGNRLPQKLTVACSGGADSLAITHFLSRRHDVTVAYFNHGSDFDNMSQYWMQAWCDKYGIKFKTASITRDKDRGESQEEYWRNQRYSWFHSMDEYVVTGHHLDDCVETWIWSSMNGEGKIIPYAYNNVIRPFRLNPKKELEQWCERHNVEYLTDPTNTDTKYTRNYIRHTMMPHVLKINPGIQKVIIKKIAAQMDQMA